MHAVHHTQAFILKSQPAGEANRRVWLFTETFGLIVAMVQGVRKQGAKLQMNIGEYTVISADLVKGKDIWRLVSATVLENPLHENLTTDLARSYVRTLHAVERFCQGEEGNAALFHHLHECTTCLTQRELDARSLDTVSLWKVMAILGYIAPSGAERKLLEMPLVEAAQTLDQTMRERLIRETNSVIQTTHL